MGFASFFRRRTEPAATGTELVVVEALPMDDDLEVLEVIPVVSEDGPDLASSDVPIDDRATSLDYTEADEFDALGLVFDRNRERRIAKAERHAFSDHLVKLDLVPRKIVNIALAEQRVTGEKIGAILVRNGFLRHDVLIRSILEFSPESIATERVASCRIPVEILSANGIIISAETEDTLYVGSLSPEPVVDAIMQEYYPEKSYRSVAFYPENLEDFLDRMSRSDTNDADATSRAAEHEKLDRLLAMAMARLASDIHIEPRGSSYSVFFRILGVRQHIHEGDTEEYNVIVSQIKDRSRMDIAERRLGQDGGFKMEFNGKYIDLRSATVPTVEGEQVVIRILDPDRVDPKLDNLGISRLDRWRQAAHRKNGIALICGETGSGKTTTLMSTIKEFDRIGKKVYTAEDPPEYRLPFVGQVPINHTSGVDYNKALKNFMRADPDIIILGEVRDEETARNAIKAAETGHMVIATLHTSSIVSAVSRLRDLKVAPHELRYILRGVLVQTLVRCLCTTCDGKGSFRGSICPRCDGTGHDRRTIVSECTSFMKPEEVDRVLAMGSEAGSDFEPDWTDMLDDAIAKMQAGECSIFELRRVFGSVVDIRVDELGLDTKPFEIGPPSARI